jgi:O-antigen/teichoic acid export membrane protein
MQIDQVMIGNMLDMSDVGIYGVAVKLTDIWLFVPSIAVSTAMPFFVDLREKGDPDYRENMMRLYSILFWSGAVLSVCIILFGRVILSVVFGDAYIGAYPALSVLVIGMIIRGQSLARKLWIIVENLQRYIVLGSLLGAMFNVILNFILIPIYGVLGAAVSTLITILFNNWIIPIFIIKQYRQNTLDSIIAINPMFLFSTRSRMER